MHQFGVWAPKAQQMTVQVGSQKLPMQGPDRRGWWRLDVPEAECGSDYGFLIDDDATVYPDPRSLSQPEGVHGLSRLYDHSLFQWTDSTWRGASLTGGILYELHVGTFSEEGTFDGAIAHLDYLADLGITHIELMPVNSFAGDRGWGYDGVALFAPQQSFGGPDGLKRLVDAAHSKGLAIVLDVVYNHFGPVGNYTNKFGPYLTDRHRTPWGAAVNLNEGGSDDVRRYFIDNAQMWLRDYHIDGLRLDAIHELFDRSAVHFLEQLSADVERLGATTGRNLLLIAESDLNDPRIIRSREANGYGMDSQWSDDFHHSLFTILYTKEPGRGYYDDFGKIKDLVKALRHAFVFDGNYSIYRKHSHGRPVANLSAHHFIHFDQNHDQVGNRALGERLHMLVGMDAAKVSVGLLLTAPYLPMLFMGQEFAASSPFLYFADHEEEEMRRLVAEGRKRDFSAFGYDADEIPNPEDAETYEESKLNWSEVHEGEHAEMLAWTKSLIKLRRATVAFNDGDMGHLEVEGDEKAKTLTMARENARVLINFGESDANFSVRPEECLALSSRAGLNPENDVLRLPGMTLVVLLCSTESFEAR